MLQQNIKTPYFRPMMSATTKMRTAAMLMAAALATVSCSDVDMADGDGTGGNTISFGLDDDGWNDIANTRLAHDGLTTSFEDGDAIGINAWYTADGSSNEQRLMENVKAIYNSSTSTFAYSPTQFWPTDGTLNITAYYPYTSQTSGTRLALDGIDREDVMMAAAQYTSRPDDNTAHLAFKHLQARLQFLLLKSDDYAGDGEVTNIDYSTIQPSQEHGGMLDYSYDAATGDITSTSPLSPNTSDDETGVHSVAVSTTLADSKEEAEPVCIYLTKKQLDTSRTLYAVITVDGEEKNVEITLPDELAPGMTCNVVITVKGRKEVYPEGEEEETDANCYILHPTGNVYTGIPVDRINKYWKLYASSKQDSLITNSAQTEWYVSVVWSSKNKRLVDFYDKQHNKLPYEKGKGVKYTGNGRFYVKANGEGTGNVLVQVKKADSDKTLWSWHLWVTDYNPDALARQGDPGSSEYYRGTSDGKGEGAIVHPSAWNSLTKYFFFSGKSYPQVWMMDRNLGADAETNVPCSISDQEANAGRVTYQWGRKDPLPSAYSSSSPMVYVTDDNETFTNGNIGSDMVSYKSFATYDETVENPRALGTGDKLLASDSNNSGWGAWQSSWHTYWRSPRSWSWYDSYNYKSFYDPCPYGWKVASKTMMEFCGNGLTSQWGSKSGSINGSAVNAGSDNAGANVTLGGNHTTWIPAAGDRNHNTKTGALVEDAKDEAYLMMADSDTSYNWMWFGTWGGQNLLKIDLDGGSSAVSFQNTGSTSTWFGFGQSNAYMNAAAPVRCVQQR